MLIKVKKKKKKAKYPALLWYPVHQSAGVSTALNASQGVDSLTQEAVQVFSRQLVLLIFSGPVALSRISVEQ